MLGQYVQGEINELGSKKTYRKDILDMLRNTFSSQPYKINESI